MNTTTTTTTRLALGMTLAAFLLGAAACGTGTAADSADSPQQQTSVQPEAKTPPHADKVRAELENLVWHLRAERARRWARHHQPTEHPPGSFHSDTPRRP